MSIPRGKREGAAGCKPLYPLRAESASGSAGDVDALRMASVTAAPSDKREWNREVFFRLSCPTAWEAFLFGIII